MGEYDQHLLRKKRKFKKECDLKPLFDLGQIVGTPGASHISTNMKQESLFKPGILKEQKKSCHQELRFLQITWVLNIKISWFQI